MTESLRLIFSANYTEIEKAKTDTLALLDIDYAGAMQDAKDVIKVAVAKVVALPVVSAAQTSYLTTMNSRATQGLDLAKYGVSVTVATTANITLSGLLKIDGIQLVAGNRVLVKNQTNTKNNGIYVAKSTAWTRSTDDDSVAEMNGLRVFISLGTVGKNTSWTANNNITALGTSAITFTKTSNTGVCVTSTIVNAKGILEAAVASSKAITLKAVTNYPKAIQSVNDYAYARGEEVFLYYNNSETDYEARKVVDSDQAMEIESAAFEGVCQATIEEMASTDLEKLAETSITPTP